MRYLVQIFFHINNTSPHFTAVSFLDLEYQVHNIILGQSDLLL